jgi:hypothetical protein
MNSTRPGLELNSLDHARFSPRFRVALGETYDNSHMQKIRRILLQLEVIEKSLGTTFDTVELQS